MHKNFTKKQYQHSSSKS